MSGKNFLRKLASYDGAQYLLASLQKKAVPLADVSPMVNMQDLRPETQLTPAAQQFLDKHFQGNIKKYQDLRYPTRLPKEEEDKMRPDFELLSEQDAIDLQKKKFEDLEKENLGILKRFFGKKYREDAKRMFEGIDVPVYIIPVFSRVAKSSPSRASFLTWEEALPALEQSEFDLEKLKSELDSGAIVFLSSSTSASKGNLPSPWMLIHAFFDNFYTQASERDKRTSPFRYFQNNVVLAFEDLLADIYDIPSRYTDAYEADEYSEKIEKAWRGVAQAITSKSGRSGYFKGDQEYTIGDVLGELLSQAVLKGNCTLNCGEDENLQIVEDWINSLNIRQMLVDRLRGKIVEVDVS